MLTKTLKPFSPPSALFAHFFISSGVIVVWALYLVFAFWALYTIVAVYHWLKYSRASWVASPAIAVHLLISLVLISYALSGHIFFLS